MYSPTTQPETHSDSHQQNLSELVMAMMGVDRLAYIRLCESAGYRVHAADGTELASFDSREDALSSIQKFNLMPVSVH